MFLFFLLFSFVLSFFFFVYFSFHCKKFHKQQLLQQQELLQQQLLQQKLLEQHRQDEEQKSQIEPPLLNRSLPVDKTAPTNEDDQTHFSHALLLEILPSDSTKCAGLLIGESQAGNDAVQSVSVREMDRVEPGGEEHKTKKNKKKKRGKKKSLDSKGEEEKKKRKEPGSGGPSSRFAPYPFTSTSSATQRKIKKQYDKFVKCKENEGLEAMAKVGEFSSCLIAARNDLEHKSEVFKRKSTITNALLTKADRSSLDRLSQQRRKLEMEQKRLEEDGRVYNWMQEQLNRSTVYKKMLILGGCLELKAQAGELTEDEDTEEFEEEISFEELLAQEKKDAFWQKNGKPNFSSN